MALVGEATIEIDLLEFWEWVSKTQHPELKEVLYGVPRINKSNLTMEIDVAFSEYCSPKDWAEKSKAQNQWEELK